MRDNKSLLRKMKIKKGFNLISMPSVSLTEEEANTFIDYMYQEISMVNYARIEKMALSQKNIRGIGFGSGRFLYPSSQFNESKYKKQWSQNKIQLQTVKLRGAIAVFDDDLEDVRGVESSDAYKDKLMRVVTKKVGNELEEIFYIGNTGASPNNFAEDDARGELNGWRYQICNSASGEAYYNNAVPGGAHLLNACDGGSSGSPFTLAGEIAEQNAAAPYNWEFKYHGALKTMPSKYKTGGLKNFRFLNSDLVTMDYLEALSARATILGDSIFSGTAAAAYHKVPIVDVPLMPHDLGTATAYGTLGGGAYTDVLLTPIGNLVIGIQRDIKIEAQRVAADEATYFFYSIRACCAIENINAVVLVRCLTHRC